MLELTRNETLYANGYLIKRNGILVFSVTWDHTKPKGKDKPWRLTSSLPGYSSKAWHFSTPEMCLDFAKVLFSKWTSTLNLEIKNS